MLIIFQCKAFIPEYNNEFEKIRISKTLEQRMAELYESMFRLPQKGYFEDDNSQLSECGDRARSVSRGKVLA